MNTRSFLLGLGVAVVATVSGLRADPSIDFVLVQKNHDFMQTGTSSVVEANGSVDPAGFSVSLEGSGLSGYGGTLSFTSPGGSGVAGGTGSYNSGNNSYAFKQTFSGGSAYADLDAAFADGTYDVNVDGTHVALNLSGGVFPSAPLATITGTTGVWNAAEYIIQPGHDLTISSVFSDAANYSRAHISLEISGNGLNQSFDQFATSAQLDLLAASLVSGQSYNVRVGFAGVVDSDEVTLAPATAAALYTSETTFLLTVASPVPEPARCALLFGATGLLAGIVLRRRVRLLPA